MKKKICLGILILGFLVLTGSFGFGYVNKISSSIKLDSLQPGADGSTTSFYGILIAETDQNIQIIFNTTGDLKREELDRTGSGLERYDTLGTTILDLTVRGMSAMEFNWNGSMDKLNEVITPAITPSTSEKIWMDIDIQAGRAGPDYGVNNEWNESSDAGIYSTTIIMTVVGQ